MMRRSLFLLSILGAVSCSLFFHYPDAHAKPIVIYNGNIAVPNTGTIPTIIGDDVYINAEEELDLAVGSSITIENPTGLKFDTAATLTLITSEPVSNVTTTGSVKLQIPDGGYSSDKTKVALKVTTGNAVGDSVKVNGMISAVSPLKILPTSAAAKINATGFKLTVKTNANTSAVQSAELGSIAILSVPKILSARFVDKQHFTIQFNCNLDSNTARSTALGTGRDLSTVSTNGLLIENYAIGVFPAEVTIDGADSSKVNVAITTGELRDDGTTTVKTTASGLAFANVLDPQETPTITSTHRVADHTPVNIIKAEAAVQSVTLSKTSVGASTSYAPFLAGVPVLTGLIADDAFIATINSTAGIDYKARLAYSTTTTVTPFKAQTGTTYAWQADYDTGATGGKLVDDIGDSQGVHTIKSASNNGNIFLYFQMGNNLGSAHADLGPSTENKIVVQASVDNFNTIVQSQPITVDRIVPTIVNTTSVKPTATSTYTIQAVFSEAVRKISAENTNSWRVSNVGGGTAVTVESASLAGDNKTVTVTTTVMSASKSYSLQVSPGSGTPVQDLAGNKVANASYTVTAPGGPISGITITQPSTTPPRVANGATFTVQVNAMSGASVLVHLVNSTLASTATTGFWDGGCAAYPSGCQLSEATSGVYKGTITVNTTSSGTAKVIASTDGFVNRTVSTDTITIDNTGPVITSTVGIGCKNALVNFNETIITSTIDGSTTAFTVTPNLGTVTSQTRPSKDQVLLTFGGTASTGITYTVSTTVVKDEVGNPIGPFNSGTFTAPGCDQLSPTIEKTEVAAGETKVSVYLTDDSGKSAVDMNSNIGASNTRITSVLKNGVSQSGVITNDTASVASIFTPDSPFTTGTYNINIAVADLAGNTGLRSTSFTVYEPLACAVNPSTITILGDTATISASGGKSPYTETITSDTTGGATITGSGPWTLIPGPTAGSITVRISDSQTPARTCDVTVTYTPCILTVAASKSAVNGEKISVAASGGTPPYVFELTTIAPTGAAIDPLSGDYLAPSVSGGTAAGAAMSGTLEPPERSSTIYIETIRATDVNRCIGTTTVKISASALSVTTEVLADKVYFSVSIGTGSSGSGGIIIRPSTEGEDVLLSIHNADMVSTTGMEGVTAELLNSCGSVDSSGVYTAPSEKTCVASVKLSKGGEWAKVFIEVKNGIPEVIEGIEVQDVNMDTIVDVNDITPVLDWILK